ncbi:hypothetical protein [Magnetospirillum fulvum]|nr:hypothetical protein [Magnetospirillum fulvum]
MIYYSRRNGGIGSRTKHGRQMGMTLKLLAIYNAGDLDKENVLLQADADCQLNAYIICDNTYASDGTITNRHCHMYHFQKKSIKKGDYVVLFTKVGKNSEGTYKEAPLHRFYWGVGSTVWNKDGDCAHLLQVKSVGNIRTK